MSPEPLSLTRQAIARARPRRNTGERTAALGRVGELTYISPVETPRDGVRLREARFARLLAAADMVAAGVALLTAVTLLSDDHLRVGALVILPVAVVVSKLAGLYDRDDNRLSRRTLDEA